MSKFNTIEHAHFGDNSNGLSLITVKSKNLKGRGEICLYVTEEGKNKPLPIVILLHGVYGGACSWIVNGQAHMVLQKLIDNKKVSPMILAMPSDGMWGDGSGYLPHNGFDFEKWIVEDVPAAVYEKVPQANSDQPIYISGLSMGGFGALRLGIKHHQIFSGISAHSSITSLDQMGLFVEENLDNYRQEDKSDEDVWGTLLKHKNSLPPLRFDCGVSDQLIEYNRTLHQKLEKHSLPHTYEEFDGAHEWDYWTKHLEDTLLFFQGLS